MRLQQACHGSSAFSMARLFMLAFGLCGKPSIGVNWCWSDRTSLKRNLFAESPCDIAIILVMGNKQQGPNNHG